MNFLCVYVNLKYVFQYISYKKVEIILKNDDKYYVMKEYILDIDRQENLLNIYQVRHHSAKLG